LYFDSRTYARPSARDKRTFVGLALQDQLKDRLQAGQVDTRCGLQVVDTFSGDTVARVRIEGVEKVLFVVIHIPGSRSPAAIGIKGPEFRRTISLAPV